MSRSKIGLLVLGGLAIAFVLFYLAIPSDNKQYIVEKLSQLGKIGSAILYNVLILLSLLTSALLFGVVIYLGLQELDRRNEADKELTGLEETLIVVGIGLIPVLGQVIISKLILEVPDTWIRPLVDVVGIHAKNPFFWGFFGFVFYLFGYFLVGRVAEHILHEIVVPRLNSASG